MKGSILIAICLLLVLQGCARLNFSPPKITEVKKSQVFDIEFGKAWTRAVDWFADHNVIIEKIERPSGLLTARYRVKVSDEQLDCGEFDVTGTLGAPVFKRLGSLNVTVREVKPGQSRVNVNFFGDYELIARDAWDGRSVVQTGRCYSTGKLEKEILKFIGDS